MWFDSQPKLWQKWCSIGSYQHAGAMATAVMAFAASASVHAASIEILTEPRAMSMVIMRIHVDALPDDRSVYVDIKGPDDEDFQPADLIKPGDTAISGSLFSEADDGGKSLIVPAFLIGGKTTETARHPFAEAGTYTLRLRAYGFPPPGGVPEYYTVFQTQVVFSEPSEQDRAFFELAQQENIRSLLNTDGELAGFALIYQIVESTRRRNDPTHGKSEWAAPLYALALSVPDSSYAPYLAYYAGCSFMWQKKSVYVKREFGYDLPDARFAHLQHFQQATSALEFSIKRGDAYIKPLAECFLATMKAWSADFAGARAVLAKVGGGVSAPLQVRELVRQLDRFIEAQERVPKR